MNRCHCTFGREFLGMHDTHIWSYFLEYVEFEDLVMIQ